MIPKDNLVEWRATTAPWVDDAQVEQDLVLSRAVVEIFNDPWLYDRLAFRGGTVLHKCLLPPAARYSDDIDLVTTAAEPIGPIFDRLRDVLRWIGDDRTKMSTKLGAITFTFNTTSGLPLTMKVKVEINSREHEPVFGYVTAGYAVQNSWFTGSTVLRTYALDELMGTKLRALHQRRKGRDLFDLDLALRHPTLTPARVREAFLYYMSFEQGPLTRARIEETLAKKMQHPAFLGDTAPLLRTGVTYDAAMAYARVLEDLVTPLPHLIVAAPST